MHLLDWIGYARLIDSEFEECYMECLCSARVSMSVRCFCGPWTLTHVRNVYTAVVLMPNMAIGDKPWPDARLIPK